MVQVQWLGGAVSDRAGNPSVASGAAFTLDILPPVGVLSSPTPGSTIDTDPGYVEVQWLALSAAGLEAQILRDGRRKRHRGQRGSPRNLGNGLVRYWYNDDGQTLPPGVIQVQAAAGAVTDTQGHLSDAWSASFTVQAAEPVDVTSLVTVEYYGRQFNRQTGVYSFYGKVTNQFAGAVVRADSDRLGQSAAGRTRTP